MAALSEDAQAGARDCGTFMLELVGTFAPSQVSMRWSDAPRATCEAVDRLIEQTWTDHGARAERDGLMFFDGPLCRLADWSANNGALVLTLGPVSYKEFLGTNATHANLRYAHGSEVLADPLGVSAAMTTADHFVLLGRRSHHVVQYARRIHPVGGLVAPSETPDKPPDPFTTMQAELDEELALPVDCIASMRCIGLVRDKHTAQPELILDVAADADVTAIRRAQKDAADACEHTGLEAVRNDAGSMVNFIEQRYAELTPVALATLLLHGLHSWGTGWFAAARGYCRSVI
ncbi:MAG: hypothetical protein KGY99_04155 [Phycisphaerae bacterium]|nr:hypothetical protein [Phycisphaerae bacterium]